MLLLEPTLLKLFPSSNPCSKKSSVPTKSRESNFELLRIVAMMLIVAHHSLIAIGMVDYYSPQVREGELANSFLVCGVDCFVLISGYFGINFRLSKLVRFCFTIAFVAVVEIVAASIPGVGQYINLHYALHKILPFFRDSNWFIPSYLGLMVVAPVVNKAIANASRAELVGWMIGLSLLNLYAYIFSVGAISSAGYNLFNIVYLYFVGRILSISCVCEGNANIVRCVGIIMYVAGSIAAYFVSVAIEPGFRAFAYNSPQVVSSAVGLFVFFGSLRFCSRVVNLVGGAVFCVFLSHYAIIYCIVDSSRLTVGEFFVVAFVAGITIGIAARMFATRLQKFVSKFAV